MIRAFRCTETLLVLFLLSSIVLIYDFHDTFDRGVNVRRFWLAAMRVFSTLYGALSLDANCISDS